MTPPQYIVRTRQLRPLTNHGDVVCVLYSSNLSSVRLDVLERLHVVDGEDTQEALSRSHVLVSHGAILLLTCRVQDIEQTGFSVDHHLFPGAGQG